MMEWHVAEDLNDHAAVVALEDDSWRRRAVVIKENQRRTVYHVPANGACPGLYVKFDHPPGWRDRIKNLWRFKPQLEFLAGAALQRSGVPVVHFLSWGRDGCDGALASLELVDAQPFNDAWRVARSNPEIRRHFIGALGRFLKLLVEHGVDHPDLHQGNVLYTAADEGVFHLVDVYGVRVGVPSDRLSCCRILVWLFIFLHQLDDAEQGQCLATVIGPDGAFPHFERRDLYRWHERMARRCWRRRRHQYFRDSSICKRLDHSEMTGFLRRELADSVVEECLSSHAANMGRDEHVLKRGKRRQLSEVTVDGVAYVVKEFRVPGPWAMWRPDRICWRATQRLRYYAVPTAEALAWVRLADGRGFVIFEKTGDSNLALYLREHYEAPECAGLCAAAGRLLAWIHLAGIIPRDLKLSNVMIHAHRDFPGMPLTLVDTDAVAFRRTVGADAADRNLRQMLDALPKTVDPNWPILLQTAYNDEMMRVGPSHSFSL